jgi:hypothetical protein
MANNAQNGRHLYSSSNTELEDEMETAVREALGEVALPPEVGGNANGENSDDSDYSWNVRVADLEGEVFKLKDEMKSLKEKCRNGFYVFEEKHLLQHFEENLALYLYPRGRMFGKTEIFPRLMTWLNDRRNTREGVVANNKWVEVKYDHGVQWNQHHEEVLTKMRNLLPDTTHPVEMWNPISFTEKEKRCIADLNHLSKCLTALIEKREDESD